jgi:nitroimidazol reductase NimA-like FMN-containing flavoprotein (pyridoxamine 5'-phosphate oxidase superfamily)
MPKDFTVAERQEFLAGKHIAVLSVAAADGRPPASVPIWYDYTPGETSGSTPVLRDARPSSSSGPVR